MSSATVPKVRRQVDWVKVVLGVITVLTYLFLFLPIAFVVAHSFNDGSAFLLWGGFSTRWYGRLWENEPLKESIISSIRVAIGSTVIAVILGGLAGIALARRGGKWTIGFVGILFLILVTPEIVDAIAYLIWFVRLGGDGVFGVLRLPFLNNGLGPLDAGTIRMWIGHSLFSSAVVTLIVRARMQGLDESLEEAAADLGATPWRAFRQITLPLVTPALLAGGLLAFTFSLDNTIVSSFVGTAGSTTFPMYVFSAVRSVLKPDIGAAATLIFLFTLLALGLVAVVLRRSGESSKDIATTLGGG